MLLGMRIREIRGFISFNMKKIFEKYKGIGGAILGLITLSYGFCEYLPKLNIVDKNDNIIWISVVILTCFLGILIILTWLVCVFIKKLKAVPKFKNQLATVLLALDYDEGLLKIRDKLYRRFKDEIEENDLKDILSCDFITDEEKLKTLRTREDAAKLRNESGCMYAAIGRLEADTEKGVEIYSIPQIHISFSSKNKLNWMPNVNLLKPLSFKIKAADTLSDTHVVAQNLYFLADVMLAFCLAFSKHCDIADRLLDKLFHDLKVYSKDKNYLGLFLMVTDLRGRNKDYLLIEEYREQLLPNITNQDYSELVLRHLNEIENLAKSGFVSFEDLHYKAILKFHLGDVKAAIAQLKEAKKAFKNHSDCVLSCESSFAFLYMWRKNYQLAYNKYMHIQRKGIAFSVAQSIITFNEFVIKNNPERADLLFIIAFMRRFEHSQLEREDFELFICKNQETEESKCLFEYAKKRLEDLPKDSI